MNKSNKFSPEVRERAVRLVQEHRGEYPSLWAAVESIAPKIGCVPQTLNEWVKRDEIDTGARPERSRKRFQAVSAEDPLDRLVPYGIERRPGCRDDGLRSMRYGPRRPSEIICDLAPVVRTP